MSVKLSQTRQNVRIHLYENRLLNAGRNTCVGRVLQRGSVSIDDLARDVAERGSEIHESILVSAVSQILEAAFDRVKRGFSVDLGLCHLKLGVQGVFDAASSRFDTEANALSLMCTPAARAADALQCVCVQKVEKKDNGPHITDVCLCAGDPDGRVKSGGLIRIAGNKIKIAGSSPDNGVWFVREAASGPVRVRAKDVVMNNPSFIQVIVPQLDDGLWHVEIVTQFVHASNTTKTPRICRYERALTVGNAVRDAETEPKRVPAGGGMPVRAVGENAAQISGCDGDVLTMTERGVDSA